MTLNEYYDRLDHTTRGFIATAYVRAIKQLKMVEHPALSSDHADETSALLCRRIVSRSTLGVRDPEELRAYAIAGIDPRIVLRRLRAARAEFEARQRNYEQLRLCLAAPGKFNRSSLRTVVKSACNDLAATKAKYMSLLVLWAEEPWRLHSFGAAPQRRFRLASLQNICFD